MKPPILLGKLYELKIDNIGSSGEGVGRYEGFTVFVPNTLPTETVQVRITTLKKQYAIGELVKVISPSEKRTEPRCELYAKCGGCQLQHASYEYQLELKTQRVRDVVERIAKDDPAKVLPTLGQAEPWFYRNKMQMPVGTNDNKLVMGFYERGSHKIVDGDYCYIQAMENNKLAAFCRKLILVTNETAYNESTGQGNIRHIIGRVGSMNIPNSAHELMLIIVSTRGKLNNEKYWVENLKQEFPNIKSIVINHNPKNTNVILGSKNRHLYGNALITDNIGYFTFNISPHSFFQVNPIQTELLYNTALEFADLKGTETVIDAYCGTGTISLFLAQKAAKVIGIEIVAPAIENARANAMQNKLNNCEFIVGDATKVMPQLLKTGLKPEVIVMDPARAGCTPEVITAVKNMRPAKIVYVSCNPSTLARDIELLTKEGTYQLVKIQPVDMFPHTAHVETVVLLSKVNTYKE